MAATVVLILGACVVIAAGLGIRTPATRSGRECDELAKVLAQTGGRTTVHCTVANATSARLHTAEGGAPTCSPVCADALDVVVVLGASETPLVAADAAYLQRMSNALLKHFDLSRTHGSQFGFVDISGGLEKPVTVAPLGDDRQALSRTIQSWTPRLGGIPVAAAQLQGLENQPAMIAMLKNARPEARRTLLLLTLPPKEQNKNMTAMNFPILLSANATGLNFDEQVMQFLTSVCPAVTIDPSLECGRMRWGHGSDTSGPGEIQPFGE